LNGPVVSIFQRTDCAFVLSPGETGREAAFSELSRRFGAAGAGVSTVQRVLLFSRKSFGPLSFNFPSEREGGLSGSGREEDSISYLNQPRPMSSFTCNHRRCGRWGEMRRVKCRRVQARTQLTHLASEARVRRCIDFPEDSASWAKARWSQARNNTCTPYGA